METTIMNTTPHIIAFAGSTRQDSFNARLVAAAAEGARKSGADVTLISLSDYAMPLYDGDLEAEGGLPESALKLKALFEKADGFLIASPEYNSGYSAVLKNTLDWISRPVEGEAMLQQFAGRKAVIMAASPGGLGGLRGLYQLRALLQNMQVTVLPQMHALAQAHEKFAADGSLNDAGEREVVHALGAALAGALGAHAAEEAA